MTQSESEQLLNNPFDENIMNLIIVAEYNNDNNARFHTIFKPIKDNSFVRKWKGKAEFFKI